MKWDEARIIWHLNVPKGWIFAGWLVYPDQRVWDLEIRKEMNEDPMKFFHRHLPVENKSKPYIEGGWRTTDFDLPGYQTMFLALNSNRVTFALIKLPTPTDLLMSGPDDV